MHIKQNLDNNKELLCVNWTNSTHEYILLVVWAAFILHFYKIMCVQFYSISLSENTNWTDNFASICILPQKNILQKIPTFHKCSCAL